MLVYAVIDDALSPAFPLGELRASEIWTSREQFEAYGEKFMPILSDMGIEFSAEPEIFEVRNLVR